MRKLATWAAILATAPAAWAAADGLPRHRLEPGTVLTYKASGEGVYPKMTMTVEAETTAWVVGREGDGVRVILRKGSRYETKWEGEPAPPKREPMDYEYGRIVLRPDGRIETDEGDDVPYRLFPSRLFPRLPADQAQAESGWSARDEGQAEEARYSALRAEPGGWSFRVERFGPENRVYESTDEATYHFDAGRGLVRRIEGERTQNYDFQAKGTEVEELTSVETLGPEKLAAFAKAADAFFEAERAYLAAARAGVEDATKVDAALAEARAKLVAARDAAGEPAFREALDRRIERHDASAANMVDDAKSRADAIGKPATPWTFPGLDGKSHALADYRGKVVVLDFWYRGCGWCVKAMPQMNAVAEDFAGRPVAVLGMNNDRDEGDAKLVAEVMGLKYPTIRVDPDFLDRCGVQGFPTVIVVDPEGVVRDVHVGYSKDLRAKLGKSIEALLSR